MSPIAQFIVSMIVNTINTLLIIYFGYKNNGRIERLKSHLTRNNYLYNMRYEKIANIVGAIWDCYNAYELMLTLLQKKEGDGEFEPLRKEYLQSPRAKEAISDLYRDASDRFIEIAGRTSKSILGSRLWLGEEIYSASMTISDTFGDYVRLKAGIGIVDFKITIIKLQNVKKSIHELEGIALSFLEK